MIKERKIPHKKYDIVISLSLCLSISLSFFFFFLLQDKSCNFKKPVFYFVFDFENLCRGLDWHVKFIGFFLLISSLLSNHLF